MKYKQGDLVSLRKPILLPDDTSLAHPVLIVSSDFSNSYENHYTGLMMTSSVITDRFSFSCKNNMFERPLEKTGCHLRLYILVGFNESEVSTFKNRMEKSYLIQVIDQLKECVICV